LNRLLNSRLDFRWFDDLGFIHRLFTMVCRFSDFPSRRRILNEAVRPVAGNMTVVIER
jgi:hypothetical protein